MRRSTRLLLLGVIVVVVAAGAWFVERRVTDRPECGQFLAVADLGVDGAGDAATPDEAVARMRQSGLVPSLPSGPLHLDDSTPGNPRMVSEDGRTEVGLSRGGRGWNVTGAKVCVK